VIAEFLQSRLDERPLVGLLRESLARGTQRALIDVRAGDLGTKPREPVGPPSVTATSVQDPLPLEPVPIEQDLLLGQDSFDVLSEPRIREQVLPLRKVAPLAAERECCGRGADLASVLEVMDLVIEDLVERVDVSSSVPDPFKPVQSVATCSP
jgi:hypothetical protein